MDVRARGCVSADGLARTFVWDRTFGYWRRSGMLWFHDHELVLVQTPIGDKGIPSRRICLKTCEVVKVPLMIGYQPDHVDAIRNIAARIRPMPGR